MRAVVVTAVGRPEVLKPAELPEPKISGDHDVKVRLRAAGPVDLLIAATAERERLTVLCDDHDFETVAAVTGQPVKLVTDV